MNSGSHHHSWRHTRSILCTQHAGYGSVFFVFRYERKGVEGPVIKPRCDRDFPRAPRPVLGPTQSPAQPVPGVFPGVERPGRGADHPLPYNAGVKEYSYTSSPSGPSWPVLGRTLLYALRRHWCKHSQRLGKVLTF